MSHIICDKIFTQDDLIRVTYFTPKWFMVPASISHYNESLIGIKATPHLGLTVC